MSDTNHPLPEPYIYYKDGESWFMYPAANDDDCSMILLADLPPLQADHLLAHGFGWVIEGLNDEDTLAAV